MATAVVGDIHGNAAALRNVVQAMTPELAAADTIVFLGDYIDRGDDSRGCVDTILNLRASGPARVICLRGNHEDWLLRTFGNYSRHSWLTGMEAFDTIASYSPEAASALRAAMQAGGLGLYTGTLKLPYQLFFDAMPASHQDFFRNLSLWHRTPDCLCAHAGLDPTMDLAAQPDRNFIWGYPGFPEAYSGGETIVYGHWNNARPGNGGWPAPHVSGNTIGIDTSRYGVVTALRLPERRLYQSNGSATIVTCLGE